MTSGFYLEELRQILTEKRFDLLLTIARHHPGSVRELAELTSRDYKNVSADVALLERLGLVELEEHGEKGEPRRRQSPMTKSR